MRRSWWRSLMAALERQDETVRRQLTVVFMVAAVALAAVLFLWSLQRTFQMATGEPAPARSGTLPSIPQSLKASASDLWSFMRSLAGRPKSSAPSEPVESFQQELAPRRLPVPK